MATLTAKGLERRSEILAAADDLFKLAAELFDPFFDVH